MKEKLFIYSYGFFRNLCLFYVFIFGSLFLNIDQSYGKSSEIVIYDNLTNRGDVGSESRGMFSNKIGPAITTGTSNMNLISLELGNFSAGTSNYANFQLDITQVVTTIVSLTNEPVQVESSYNSVYTQTFNAFISNSLPTNTSDLIQFALAKPFTLLANTKYIISLKQITTADFVLANWVTHQSLSPQVTLLAGWSTPITYVNVGQGRGIAGGEVLYLRLLGSLPHATITTTPISAIAYGSSISAASGGSSILQSTTSITAKGICWATSNNPTLTDNYTNEGIGIDNFTSTLSNLQSNTTYYVRAYVTDDSGTYYGSETSFSTNIAPVITSGGGLSAITTSVIEPTTLVTTFQATDADVPAQNLTFSIAGGEDASKFNINATTGDLSFITAPNFEIPTDSDTNNSYFVTIAVTDNGSIPKIATQEITVTCTNVAEIPTLTTASVLTLGITGATLGALVESDGGGGVVTERGFVFSQTNANPNPSIGALSTTKVVVTGTIGNFSKVISGLSANTAYTFKAFATNATGTNYTESVNFTTNGLTAGPSFSYAALLLQQNVAVTPILPTTIGSPIPAGIYTKVATFAGSTGGNVDNANPLLAELQAPMGMAMDGSRNIYFCDSYNHRIKKIDGTTGAVTVIAGGYTPFLGFPSGDEDGAAIGAARFYYPSGITYDGQGVLYIADRENDKIRKLVLATGQVTTIAGGGTGSQSGYNNATGTVARFLKPTDVVYRVESSTAYLYVTDAGNHCIRKINLTTNSVTTFAGTNTSGTTEGELTLARFNYPTGLAFSSAGVLYVVDRGNQKIRKIDAGTVSTFAGSGVNATSNGIGTTATFADPYGIAIDGGDNLYISQALDGWYPTASPGFSGGTATNNYIRKITPIGVVTNFVGSGTRGETDNANGTLATFGSPAHILFDTNQKYMYVSEWYSDKIRRVDITGYNITPVVPSGLSFDSTNGSISGIPTVINFGPVNYSVTGNNYFGSNIATLAITVGVNPVLSTTAVSAVTPTTATSGGNVSDNGGAALLEKGICWSTSTNPTINDTKIIEGTTLTGVFTSNISGLNPLTTYYVRAYAINTLGISYGTEVSFTTIIQAPNISYTSPNVFPINTAITPLQVANTGGPVLGYSGEVSTIAGSISGYLDGTGSAAQFNQPRGITIDSNGNIYVADSGSHKIRKITPSGVVTTVAGNTQGYSNGIGTAAQFNSPNSLDIDALGNLYVADYNNHRIRKITPDGAVTTFAGGTAGFLDGIGAAAKFWYPSDIKIDASGNLFVADYANHKIRKITPSGLVSTVAGSIQGYLDGIGSDAQFKNPFALALDNLGIIYVADIGNSKIRKIATNGVVSTIAGSTSGYLDGIGSTAKFNTILGIDVDEYGAVYAADAGNNKIRKISPEGIVTTLAGSTSGSTNGSVSVAKFDAPSSVSLDQNGHLFVMEFWGHRLRKIIPPNEYSVSPALPNGLVLNNATGEISGTPTIYSPITDYIITATNSGGSSSYFTSIATVSIPMVTSSSITSLTQTNASAGGNVINDGGLSLIEKGICWSTNMLPTISDNKIQDSTTSVGNFTSGITGLNSNTLYYVRAYATNSLGTAYGDVVSFTTLITPPNINYTSTSVFPLNAAITPLQVTNTGGAITGILGSHKKVGENL